jgi:hypothetical protein
LLQKIIGQGRKEMIYELMQTFFIIKDAFTKDRIKYIEFLQDFERKEWKGECKIRKGALGTLYAGPRLWIEWDFVEGLHIGEAGFFDFEDNEIEDLAKNKIIHIEYYKVGVMRSGAEIMGRRNELFKQGMTGKDYYKMAKKDAFGTEGWKERMRRE